MSNNAQEARDELIEFTRLLFGTTDDTKTDDTDQQEQK